MIYRIQSEETSTHLSVVDLVQRSSDVETFSDLAPFPILERVDTAPLNSTPRHLGPRHRVPKRGRTLQKGVISFVEDTVLDRAGIQVQCFDKAFTVVSGPITTRNGRDVMLVARYY